MSKAVPVLIVALIFPTAMTWFYFAQAHGATKAIYTGGKILQFSLPILWWAAVDRSRFKLPRPSSTAIWPGLLFGLAVSAGILALYFGWLRQHPMMAPLAEQAHAKVDAFGLTSPLLFLLFAVLLSLVHALLEEYYWRAFVFAELKRLAPLSVAVLISSLGFMAHHVIVLSVYIPGRFWTAAVPLSLAVAGGGAIWAIMYHRFGNIYPAWVGHILVDASLMIVGYDLLG